MNRRNFFKVVTGFVAGIFASSVEGKKRSGTRYCGEDSTGINPDSEWAKQKPLTLDALMKAKEDIDSTTIETSSNNVTYRIRLTYWDKDEPDIYTFDDGKAIIV